MEISEVFLVCDRSFLNYFFESYPIFSYLLGKLNAKHNVKPNSKADIKLSTISTNSCNNVKFSTDL